jgi:hypothetical protein
MSGGLLQCMNLHLGTSRHFAAMPRLRRYWEVSGHAATAAPHQSDDRELKLD